jgi:predicted TIM-barrel fold metal-dependent hydrolase
MIDDTFVFDAVVHFADLDMELFPEITPEERSAMLGLMNRLTGGVVSDETMQSLAGAPDAPEVPAYFRGVPEALFDMTFGQAPTDMAMVANNVPVPVMDANGAGGELSEPDFADRLQAAAADFVKAHPERAVFGGGVEPLGLGVGRAYGLNWCLEAIEFQITELDAKSIKFYPLAWKCDDEKLAYPMYEKARSLGVKVLQFHKNQPLFAENVEMHRPNDLQAPAKDFPDCQFVLHHPMTLYFDETVNIVARFPNVHLMCTPLIHYLLFKPRLAYHQIGTLLQQAGSEKLMWGSEGVMVGNPSKFVEAFANMEIPEELCDGYGYPQITKQDKQNILGLNFARMLGIDAGAKQQELATLPPGR